MYIIKTLVLTCHPDSPNHFVRSLQVQVRQEKGGAIALIYLLNGDLSRLCIPAGGTPERTDGLWQHTCFEAFVSENGEPGYREFNFAPSGAWAAYAFGGYRNGKSLVPGFDPQITTCAVDGRLELQAVIHPDALPHKREQRLLLALSAVIEEQGGKLSYWALKHPPGRPDFHHPDAFALEIDPLKMDAAGDPTYTAKS